ARRDRAVPRGAGRVQPRAVAARRDRRLVPRGRRRRRRRGAGPGHRRRAPRRGRPLGAQRVPRVDRLSAGAVHGDGPRRPAVGGVVTWETIHPAINAALNATSAVFLVLGFLAIKRKDIARHRALMIAAFSSSTVFLVSYLIRFAISGTHRYPGEGWDKT